LSQKPKVAIATKKEGSHNTKTNRNHAKQHVAVKVDLSLYNSGQSGRFLNSRKFRIFIHHFTLKIVSEIEL
jgi:hypothetical protein